MHWIGVDVGGTFTDVVVYDEDTGVLEVAKSPTHRADPTVGLLNALAKLPVALSNAGRIVYGTTIGTNAILERTGAPVWVGESCTTTYFDPSRCKAFEVARSGIRSK